MQLKGVERRIKRSPFGRELSMRGFQSADVEACKALTGCANDRAAVNQLLNMDIDGRTIGRAAKGGTITRIEAATSALKDYLSLQD